MSYFAEKYFKSIEERLDTIEYFDKNVRDELNKLSNRMMFLEQELEKSINLDDYKKKYLEYISVFKKNTSNERIQ